MKSKPTDHETSLETDAVWRLLDLATPVAPSPRFTDETVRAARLAGQPAPWWKALLSPAPLAGLAAVSAAVVIAIASLPGLFERPLEASPGFADSARAAEIQDIAETEALIVAVDHLDEFSDTELVSLIGF